MKKIKSSKRGLTFSLPEMKIGTRYKYIIDNKNKEIMLVPDQSGKVIVSKKRTRSSVKPLMDIRSSEVKELVSSADHIELEVITNGNILVHIVKKARKNLSNIVSINEIINTKVTEFIITPQMLMASGNPSYVVSGFNNTVTDDPYFDYLYKTIPSYINKKPKRKEFKKIYDVISLFAGSGMLDKAFMDGRFNFTYAVDFEKAAVDTYRHNIGNHIEQKDIREVDPRLLPKADLIIGGPCCQAYSSANRVNQNSVEAEEKRLLIDDYIRITKFNGPKVWVIENVPEIMSKNEGFYLERIIAGLSEYEVSAVIVADDKVGGYSKRRRAIIIGSKIGKIELPEQNIPYKTVKEALDKVDASWINYNDVTIPREDTARRMSYVAQGENWRSIPEELRPMFSEKTHSNVMRRLKLDEPSITLTNYRKTNIIHPKENRTLSVSEAAAISGLEKDFVFIGSLSEMQQMVANGVTQAMGRFIKNAVLNALDSCNISIFPSCI